MSRTLICQYKSYVEIQVPEAVADQIDKGEVQLFDVDWGRLEVIDKNGVEYKIEGSEIEIDYSVAQKISWKVKPSYAAIKAKALTNESKRIEERMANLQKAITESSSEDEKLPFTDSPLRLVVHEK